MGIPGSPGTVVGIPGRVVGGPGKLVGGPGMVVGGPGNGGNDGKAGKKNVPGRLVPGRLVRLVPGLWRFSRTKISSLSGP